VVKRFSSGSTSSTAGINFPREVTKPSMNVPSSASTYAYVNVHIIII